MSNARFGLRVRNGLVRGITEGVAAIDPDVLAFTTAAGITDTTQFNAINQLVIDLKTFGLWAKMKAIYPFVGGTAASHKWNLKDPRDLDAAFRLVFFGGGSHASTGWTPNGTNGYANTFLNTSLILNNNSAHLAYYSRTNSAVLNEIPIGNLDINTGANGLNLVIRRTSDVGSFRATDASSNGIVNTTVLESRGLFIGSILSSTSRKIYKNASLLNTSIINYTWIRASASIYIGAANDITTLLPSSYTNKECSFASIGDGLTDTEVSNFYTAVQNMQITLSRQV